MAAAKCPAEPYCITCLSRFSEEKIPYMESCCHLVCSECAVKGLQHTCSYQAAAKVPAYDVWDLILSRRHAPAPPIRWASIRKEGLVCIEQAFNPPCKAQTYCPFSHDGSAITQFNKAIEEINRHNSAAITSAGWTCRCSLNHDYGESCEFCRQRFKLQ